MPTAIMKDNARIGILTDDYKVVGLKIPDDLKIRSSDVDNPSHQIVLEPKPGTVEYGLAVIEWCDTNGYTLKKEE